MATFNFDVLEDATIKLNNLVTDLEKFNDEFNRLSSGLNIDTSVFKDINDYLLNSDSMMSNPNPDFTQNENIQEDLINKFTDLNNLLSNMDLTQYKSLNEFNEKVKSFLKDEYESLKNYNIDGGIYKSDTNRDFNFNLPFVDYNLISIDKDNKNSEISLRTQMFLNIIAQELNEYSNFTGNLPLSYIQGIFNLRTPLMLFFWGRDLSEWDVKFKNMSDTSNFKKIYDEYPYLYFINNSNFKDFPYEDLQIKTNNNSIYTEIEKYNNTSLFNQININADGKLKGESKNESFFELQETVGTIVSNLKDTTSKIKSDFNYAYENKYHIKIEFPFQLNQNNNTNSKLLIDNTHFVSSSIPSFSIDVLENKLNNLKRKSGGGITGDSFSVTFRDNADRDYYRFFQLWINSMYATPNWGGDIRLYRYPESYFGKISFFMLHSGGGKNPFGISNNSGGLIGGLNNLANNSAMLPEVYDFREKVYSTVQDGTVDSQNRIMLSQLTEIPYITDTLKTKENTKNNAINHTKNYYITDIISFGRIFPSQLSDIQLNSGSSELQTFDVTFEYTFPVNFSKYNINNGKMEVSFSI